MREKRWDVFVSYGHEDAAWVGELAGNLVRDGFEVFLDRWELVGGDRVTGRLEDAIRRSLSGVLVVSQHSLSRPWVREEYEALLRQAVEDPSRRLIPVLYRDAELPAFLANRLWVDFRGTTTGPGYDDALERLERSLQGKAAGDRPRRGEARVWPAGAGGEVVRPAGSMRLSLVIEPNRVSLLGGAHEHDQSCAGLRPATVEAVKSLQRLWQRGPSVSDAQSPGEGLDGLLGDVGRRLSGDFLAGEVGAALAGAVADAARLNEVIEFGIQAPALSALPWETLALPNPDGTVDAAGATALALHRNVALYREVGGLGAVAAYKVRGPLRILVAIASPDSQNVTGELLNYEAELARIVAAVDPARRGADAHVHVLSDGSLAAIRSALTAEAEGFHVLHLSCHAQPGELILETADGERDPVSAQRLLTEGLPAGVDLPMVVLSGCSTGLAARAQPPSHEGAEGEGEQALGGVARQLLEAGVPVVLAMQAPVTDSYAAELTAALYGYLASAEVPDALIALSEARRGVEQARQKLPADAPRRGRAEWATPALWVRGLRMPLFNRREPFGKVAQSSAPVLAEGIVVRKVGEFVGRRQQLRLARRALAGAKAGLVIHGIGGVGKSTLAAEVITSPGAHPAVVVSLRGALSVDRILDELGARLNLLLPADRDELAPLRASAQRLRAGDIEWTDRWRELSELILPAVPVLVLLDNFEDNLQRDDAAWRVRDPELADLLGGWVRRPGHSKLLVTSRYPFELPEGAQRRLQPLHLGPLSAAETAKLVWQLPGLDALAPEDRLRAYRDVGGHPRTLEYLDALLQGGRARFEDVAERMEQRLSKRGIDDPDAWMATHARDADSALAEAVTLAIDDVVLGDLLDALARTPLARDLVTGASVYRVPADDTALVWQLADETEPALDPARDERIARVHAAIEDARARSDGPERLTPADVGLSDDDIAAYQTDIQDLQRPPVAAPGGFAQALSASCAIGLIAPIARSDDSELHLVHRWTARAIAQQQPELVADAHYRAAHYWRWRVERIPQTESDDLEQLLEARYHHHAAGEHDAALELSEQAILTLQTWGQYGRATELCRETLQWVPDDSAKAAAYTHQLGILAQLRGDYDTAEQRYTQSLEIKERLGDQAGLASSYHQLGMLAQRRGDYDTAEQRYTQSLEIEERLGNQAGLATSYHQLGMLAQDRGDYDTAEQRYTQSLEIEERLGNQAGLASSYHQLGTLAQLRGDYDTAEQRYTQSLEIKERLGDQAGLASSYHHLGILAQRRGDYDTAEQRYTQSLEISERLGNQAGLATSYHQLGTLAQDRGDYDTAEQRYTQSLEIDERLGDPAGLAGGYHQLGMLAQDRGDYDTAEQRYTQSLEIKERLGDQAGLASSYHQLGMLAQRRGDYDTAEQRYTQSLEISERLGNQAGLASSYHQLGMLAQDRGDYDTAEQRYTQSLEIDERLGNQAGLATSYATLAMLMTARGDNAQAVGYELGALSIRMQMHDARVAAHLQRLAAARSRLGRAAFDELTSRLLDQASQQALDGLLDEHSASSDGPGDADGG